MCETYGWIGITGGTLMSGGAVTVVLVEGNRGSLFLDRRGSRTGAAAVTGVIG